MPTPLYPRKRSASCQEELNANIGEHWKRSAPHTGGAGPYASLVRERLDQLDSRGTAHPAASGSGAATAEFSAVSSALAGEPIDLVQGLPLESVREKLNIGVRMQDTGARLVAFYLVEMDYRRLYQDSGHASSVHYAECRLGMEPRRSRELLSVGRKLLELPAMDEAFCKGEISWTQVLMLTRVVTPEHEEAWLEQARVSSCRELSLEVKLARPGSKPRDPEDRKGLAEIRFPISAQVTALAFQKWELAKKQLSEERGTPVSDADCMDILASLLLSTEEDGSLPGRKQVSTSLFNLVVHQEVSRADAAIVRRPMVDSPKADGADPDGQPSDTRTGDVHPGHGQVGDERVGDGQACSGSRSERVESADLAFEGAQAETMDDPDRHAGRAWLETEEGPVPLDSGTLACIRCDAEGIREEDPEQAGGVGGDRTPRSMQTGSRGGLERDSKTSATLRSRVLIRDNHRCRSCRSRYELMVHHIQHLADHGRTHADNLITLCMRCHGLVHADLLVIIGKDQARVRFVDREGQPLHEKGETLPPSALTRLQRAHLQAAYGDTAGQALAKSLTTHFTTRRATGLANQAQCPSLQAHPSHEESSDHPRAYMRIDDLPAEVDSTWWRKHEHLFELGENGHFKFTPGFAVESPPGIYLLGLESRHSAALWLPGANPRASACASPSTAPATFCSTSSSATRVPWPVRIGHPVPRVSKTAIDRRFLRGSASPAGGIAI